MNFDVFPNYMEWQRPRGKEIKNFMIDKKLHLPYKVIWSGLATKLRRSPLAI